MPLPTLCSWGRLWVQYLTSFLSRSTGVANSTPGKTNRRAKWQNPRESGFARAQFSVPNTSDTSYHKRNAGLDAAAKISWREEGEHDNKRREA